MHSIRTANGGDAPELARIAAVTFPLACPPHTTADAIRDFIEANLTEERFREYLADPARELLIAEDDDGAAGYAMVVHGDPYDPDVAAAVGPRPTSELSKLYVDVVGVTTPGALKAILDILPMTHLLFGTDFPFWSPETTIKGLAGLKLSASDLQAIERGNALRLLPALPP